MAMNRLPEDGELELATVRLPPGRRIHARLRSGGPVAWATTEPVPDPGRVWAALSAAHRDTGLVPDWRVARAYTSDSARCCYPVARTRR